MKVDHNFIMKILSAPGTVYLGRTPRKSTTPRSPATAVTPRVANTPHNSTSIKKSYTGTGPLLITNKQENKELSFFNLLYTDMGFKNCQKFFQDETSKTKGTFTENQFIHFMRELTDLGDYQIVEMFDIFGKLKQINKI